ncbi:MAG: GNAT family N-acetyltransferase [Actinomyces sp.]|nr:GNAT family protein [Actinomyces sp.]MCI1663001.1 GNAT family N-acetyltransferase [Actinomyces sp.]MCI1788458.1 GNAT family N-acetyltransferase [Actinomyces sp.]
MLRSVWGRPPSELTLRVADPVDRGLIRSVAWAPDPAEMAVRPCLGRDHRRVDEARRSNRLWLSPWEATLPRGAEESLPDLSTYRRTSDRQQREGTGLMMVVELDGSVAGLISLSGVQRGAMSQGMLGYWMTQEAAGRGVGALAVAMVIDLVIGELGLHRIEVNVRPENSRSLGLCRKLGLRREGLRTRYMNIAGEWADHVAFAIDAESLPAGGLVRSIWGQTVA